MTEIIDPKTELQNALDAILAGTKIRVYEKRRGDDPNASEKEYIIFSLTSDPVFVNSVGSVTYRNAIFNINYYAQCKWLESAQGRSVSRARVRSILKGLSDAGYCVPSGSFSVGDIDAVGYDATIIPVEVLHETEY